MHACRVGVDGEGNEEDGEFVEQSSSFEFGVFGVLFTLSKEKSERLILYRWTLLKIALDFWWVCTYACVSRRTRHAQYCPKDKAA